MDTLIDRLNKILTNTIGYKEVLEKLAGSVSDESTRKKLKELANVKEQESETLMKIVSEEGGQIESTERSTDQEAVSWISRPLPDPKDMGAILKRLAKAEEKAKEDYDALLGEKDDMEMEEHGELLEKHRQEAANNLEYFRAKSSTGEK